MTDSLLQRLLVFFKDWRKHDDRKHRVVHAGIVRVTSMGVTQTLRSIFGGLFAFSVVHDAVILDLRGSQQRSVVNIRWCSGLQVVSSK